jgi:hypothetical protein
MSKLKSFPKIFAIGTDYVADIFKEEVEITEKVDGSQFSFGKVDGQVLCRSKGCSINEGEGGMFKLGVDYIFSIAEKLPEGMLFNCEFLSKPKHNTLVYETVPKNNIVLFGASDITEKFINDYDKLKEYAELLDIDIIPLIYKGKINSTDELIGMLKRKSYLGGADIEGIVVKNYERKFLLGGQPMPLMAGKYVSEAFKEVHRERWGAEEKTANKFEIFKQSFRTDARFEKAVQHLSEKGELENTPRDIGKLIKEVYTDIETEEKENIKEWLYKEYKDEILRTAGRGLPEWYKERLLNRSNF